MKPFRHILFSAILLAFANEAAAQTLTQTERRARLDSALAARYYRTPYDTNFVIRPEGKLTLKLRLNQTGNDFHAKGTVNGFYSEADLKTSHKTLAHKILSITRVGHTFGPYIEIDLSILPR